MASPGSRDAAADFMRMACEAAFGAFGGTSPNPAVGAVIARGRERVSIGSTMACGMDHAEVCAIRGAAGRDLAGAELYVTLEPCCHHGKTPPCTDAIIQAGIARVYLPVLDPNPRVAGKGVDALRAAGVEVIMMPEFASAAIDLIRPFSKYIQTGRAFILHKSAMTLDGRTATHAGNSQWISSDHSRYIVHRIRSLVDAVIIGCGTLVADNPTLNARPDSFHPAVGRYFSAGEYRFGGRENFLLERIFAAPSIAARPAPWRVIMGLPGRIDMSYNVFFDDRVLIYADASRRESVSLRDDAPIVRRLIETGSLVFCEGAGPAERARFAAADLASRGVVYAMLEGGARTAGSFYDAGEIDEFLYIIAPKMIGGGLPVVAGTGAETIADGIVLHDVSCAYVNGDVMYHAYRDPWRGGA